MIYLEKIDRKFCVCVQWSLKMKIIYALSTKKINKILQVLLIGQAKLRSELIKATHYF